jgi:hypothetical protein
MGDTNLLEHEDLSADFPPSELPAAEDVGHVVVHAVDEEKVPPLEALGEDCHFSEAAAGPAAGDEDSGWCFGLDEDVGAHLDAASKFSGDVAKEPVLGNTETGMLVESLDKEFAVPERDGTMGESGGTNLTSELTLDTAELVLEILGLLAEVALCRVRSDGLDSISDALHIALHSLSDDREVIREGAVVIDEQDVLETLRSIASHELSDDFGSDRRPDVVHTVRAAHLLRIVERGGAVTVGDDKDLRWREDLQCSFEGGGNQACRFVAGNHQASIFDVGLHLGLAGKVGRRRIFLEEDQKRCKGVAGFCISLNGSARRD